MYAIVKAGGRQEKVAVGDTVVVDRIDGAAGSTVSFAAVLVVDGANVTSDPKSLSGVKVTAEVIDEIKGPKVDILRYMNKNLKIHYVHVCKIPRHRNSFYSLYIFLSIY